MILKTIISLLSLLSLCALAITLFLATPASAGPLGVLAIFIFSYTLSLGVVTFFVYYISKFITKIMIIFVPKKPILPIKFKESYYYSTIIATVPVLLIGLQSVGSVGFYELFLVTLFVLLGCLYVSKKL